MLEPVHHPRLTYLSGPSFAREIADGKPTAVTIAAHEENYAISVQESLSGSRACAATRAATWSAWSSEARSRTWSPSPSASATASELGQNARAGVMTRGLREISRLGLALGADPLTFLGLAGMGDLVLTCTGDLSRNRQVGLALGHGEPLAEIVSRMNEVAEGVRTTTATCALAELTHVEMPIAEAVKSVLDGERQPKEAVERLLNRQLRNENE